MQLQANHHNHYITAALRKWTDNSCIGCWQMLIIFHQTHLVLCIIELIEMQCMKCWCMCVVVWSSFAPLSFVYILSAHGFCSICCVMKQICERNVWRNVLPQKGSNWVCFECAACHWMILQIMHFCFCLQAVCFFRLWGSLLALSRSSSSSFFEFFRWHRVSEYWGVLFKVTWNSLNILSSWGAHSCHSQ